jgi:hypothetical protein
MNRPEGSSFRIESAGFECVFDGGVTRVNLRRESANPPAPGEFDKALEQLASYSPIARRRFDEHFHQVQCFPSILRPPPVGSVRETADLPLILGDENNAKLRSLENVFIDTPGILGCRTRSPRVQKFLGELAYSVEVPRFGGSDWSKRHSINSHFGKSAAIVVPNSEFEMRISCFRWAFSSPIAY